MKWYYQFVQDDSHDTDPAMIPVLFEGLVNKQKRSLVAIGDKGGDFVILDRGNGEVVHRTVVGKIVEPRLLCRAWASRLARACVFWPGGVTELLTVNRIWRKVKSDWDAWNAAH